MNLDLSQFNDIDFENIGAWPKLVKIVFAALLALCVFVGSYYFLVADAIDALKVEQKKEQQLKSAFKSKYQLAANLKLYREQLAIMEVQFTTLLKMLPSQNEMPGLLDDVTFVATDAGLKIDSLDWEDEIEREFYIEFPIKITASGDYHQFGHLVSDVANLPRIVSLHDFVIKRGDDGLLSMDVLAKTYRFKQNAKEGAKKGAIK